MRLYLAVAVLMLAFVAYTEAQEDTLEQRFASFGESVSELGRNLADNAKNTYDKISTSEFVTSSQNWVQRQVEEMKKYFQN